MSDRKRESNVEILSKRRSQRPKWKKLHGVAQVGAIQPDERSDRSGRRLPPVR